MSWELCILGMFKGCHTDVNICVKVVRCYPSLQGCHIDVNLYVKVVRCYPSLQG